MEIRRLDLGYVALPADMAGGPRVAGVLAYLVRHEDGLILFDTGIGAEPELDAMLRTRRRPLAEALRAAGAELDEVSLVVNCHLHFDHCGGNPQLAGRPIVVQQSELDSARGPDYTLPWLVDFNGARYETLTGEAEIRPGVWVIPTPGHTAGHQCLVLRQPDGTVVLAGQVHDTASGFTDAYLARRAERDGLEPPLPGYPDWLDRLLEFDPRRVLFAHDAAVWTPPSS